MIVLAVTLLVVQAVQAVPASTDLPTGWHLFDACAVDSSARVIESSKWSRSSNNTAANCIASCDAQGYAYAGLEYGVECAHFRSSSPCCS